MGKILSFIKGKKAKEERDEQSLRETHAKQQQTLENILDTNHRIEQREKRGQWLVNDIDLMLELVGGVRKALESNPDQGLDIVVANGTRRLVITKDKKSHDLVFKLQGRNVYD